MIFFNPSKLSRMTLAALALALVGASGAFAQTLVTVRGGHLSIDGTVSTDCTNCMTSDQGKEALKGIAATAAAVETQKAGADELLKIAKANAMALEAGTPGGEGATAKDIVAALAPIWQAYQKVDGMYLTTTEREQDWLRRSPQYGAELRKQMVDAAAKGGGNTDDGVIDIQGRYREGLADYNAKALHGAMTGAIAQIVGGWRVNPETGEETPVQGVHTAAVLQSETAFVSAVLAASETATGHMQVLQLTNQLIATLVASSQRARELAAQQASSQIAWIQYSLAKDEVARSREVGLVAASVEKSEALWSAVRARRLAVEESDPTPTIIGAQR